MSKEATSGRGRWVEDATLGVGTLLVLALFALVNYLALRHYERFDWTSGKIYSLSQKSLGIAEGIEDDVDLVIFLSPESPIYGPVDELVSSYAAANPARIKKREVDPAKNLLEAQRLVKQYSIERDNVVIVATENDRRVIDEFELAEYDYSGAQFGQPPKMTDFKGEQQITSALLALIEAEKPRVLFTTGHGEADLERGGQRSFSRARDLLGNDNFEMEEWSSLGQPQVPAGTDLLVVAGPTTNFLPPELEIFSRYLSTGGRILMLLDPVFAEGSRAMVDLGLGSWLAGYGIEILDDVVVDPTSELPFFGAETLFTDSYGSHPIVEALQQTRTRVLLPLARSVSRSDDAPSGYEITELVRTSDAGWGETDLDHLEDVALDDEDVHGPVSLAVAVSFTPSAGAGANPGDAAPGGESETEPAPADIDSRDNTAGEAAASEDAGEAEEDPREAKEDATSDEEASDDAAEARLAVFGDFDFASDAQIANGANGLLLLNTLNWLVKREKLIDIEARQPEQTSLSLSQGELSQIYLLVLGLLPALAVALGVWVYLRRRR